MLIKQISVFLENKSGRLAEVTKILADNGKNINAVSIADTTDFGILRLIVNEPEEAEKVLKENGLAVSCTEVLAIAVDDKPGGLSLALEILDKACLDIEYMYAILGKESKEALIILRIEQGEKAVEVLTQNNITVLSPNEVYKM